MHQYVEHRIGSGEAPGKGANGLKVSDVHDVEADIALLPRFAKHDGPSVGGFGFVASDDAHRRAELG